jgi:hypothetical protein
MASYFHMVIETSEGFSWQVLSLICTWLYKFFFVSTVKERRKSFKLSNCVNFMCD